MEGFPELPLKRRVSFTFGVVFDRFLEVPEHDVSPQMLFHESDAALTHMSACWSSP